MAETETLPESTSLRGVRAAVARVTEQFQAEHSLGPESEIPNTAFEKLVSAIKSELWRIRWQEHDQREGKRDGGEKKS